MSIGSSSGWTGRLAISLLLFGIGIAPAAGLAQQADVRTQSSSVIPSAARSGFALAERAGAAIHTVAFDASNEFVIVAGTRPLFSPGMPASVRQAVDVLMRGGKSIDVVAFGKSGKWVVIGEDAYRHSMVPSAARARISSLLNSGQRIDSFAFSQVDPNGWVLTSGGRAYADGRLPDGMREAIGAAWDAQRDIHEISMSMRDHWVLVADDWFVTGGIGADLRRAMDDFRSNDGRSIDHVTFNLDGSRTGWAVVSNGSFAPGPSAMSRIENSFRGTRNIHWIMNAHGIRGLSIAIVEGNQVAWRRSYGQRTRDPESSVFPNSIFEAASIAKPISAVGALQLVENRAVDLHDNDIIEKIADGIVGSGQKQAFLDQFSDEDDMNLNLILSHCAGVNHQSGGSGAQGIPISSALPSTRDILLGTNGSSAGRRPVQTASLKPGTMFVYSGANYALVQAVIELNSTSGFDRHMRDLLRSLDMSSSTFTTPADWRSDRFARTSGSSGGDSPVLQYPNMAAAALAATADDLARFVIMLNQYGSYGGRSILRRGYVLALAGQQRGTNMQCANRTSSGNRGIMGLGLNANGTGTWSHGGAHNGYRSFMFARPGDRWGMVVLVNGGTSVNGFVNELFPVVEMVYRLPGRTLSL